MRNALLQRSATVVLATLLAACANSDGGDSGTGLSGTIELDGSSTVLPLAEAVAEEFEIENPNVHPAVGSSGTGGGFEKFCSGETDISNASRAIKPEEAANCEAEGIEFAELVVALDGLAVVANPENDWATCLTTEELAAIFGPDSTIESWSEVRAGFPDVELELYSPGEDSGTFDYFTDAINGEEGAFRAEGVTKSEDDNTLVTGVSGDAGGLGYFGLAYYEANADNLALVSVDGGSGCVAPSQETVQDGSYAPLSRPLYIYVRKDAVARPEVEAFVDFFLAVVPQLAEEVGYVAPAEETLTESREAFEALL